VIGLLIITVIFFSLEKSARAVKKPKTAGRKAKVPCPLCGSRLFEGERIHSIAFDLGKEKLMHIYGCPYCESESSLIRRRCPVCKRDIPMGGFVVGRMWDKPDKTHLHITGCTECKPQYKNANAASPKAPP
jgi:formate dehydrogenase maturation protein FdhE